LSVRHDLIIKQASKGLLLFKKIIAKALFLRRYYDLSNNVTCRINKTGRIIMKKKEEVTITFYAAECGEFHDLGEYTKCRTLEEAYKKYQKYCRTSANMCPAIEFSIHDPESIYSDMEYPLPLSSKDRGDLELVPYYNEHPLVNEAIRQVEQLQKQQEKKKHRDVAR